jgi:uncharacterized protein
MAHDGVTLEDKVARLHELLVALDGGALVAFSGGADSALLAVECASTLGGRSICVTADTPTLPREEFQHARAFAAAHGLRHEVVATGEMADDAFLANDSLRCYHCKNALFTEMEALASRFGARWILYGAIADDAQDWRPGMEAAREHGALAPLLEAGFTKADVRARSRELGLETWDKPAAACLSSRFPSGVPITLGDLAKVEGAEEFLKSNGFRQCRARLMADSVRIEVEAADLERIMEPGFRKNLVAAMKRLGFRFVTVDLEGFRSGSLSVPHREKTYGIRRNT